MNKVEALKACLDGKVVAFGQELLRYSAAVGSFEYARTDSKMTVWRPCYVNSFDVDGYELHVDPPREVTRAEAWAALDLGKRVKIVDKYGSDQLFHRRDSSFYDWAEWASCDEPKFYILEGEP